jgi:hypothetical protein
MLKTLALVVAGLVAGFAVAFWLLPSAPTAARDLDSATTAPAGANGAVAASASRLATLEDALAAETERRTLLEQRVGELAAALDELRAAAPAANERVAAAATNAEPTPTEAPRARFRRDGPPSAEDLQRRQIELLVAGGFAPDRAEWIYRRTQELRMQALQAQYEARREGRPLDSALGEESTLRAELGDADYERYLTAFNRSTSVNVLTVLASSPAERVGLKPGDQIVSYGGERVFDARELNALTFQGTAGESVVVEVRRDGQPLQLVLPRGPLGITGGFDGPPFRGGGPN